MGNNEGFVLNACGSSPDWVELHNFGTSPIPLQLFGLSDNLDAEDRWYFPNDTLFPNDHYIVWATGGISCPFESHPQCDFAVNKQGENVYLFLEDTLVQIFNYSAVNSNESFGFYGESDETGSFECPSFLAFNHYSSTCETLEFSIEHNQVQTGELLFIHCSQSDALIRFTNNGEDPNFYDATYSGGIVLNPSMINVNDITSIPLTNEAPGSFEVNKKQQLLVIRARAFSQEGAPISECISRSFFFSETQIDSSLPLVSIMADSLHLFDHNSGILVPGIHYDENDPLWSGNYYQRGRVWERKVNVELISFSEGEKFNQFAGLRTHGGNARRMQQKGLRLYAREEYGSALFQHQLFHSQSISSQKNLVLKPFNSSWSGFGLEDYCCGQIASFMGLPCPESTPVSLYLNGEYWGIYFLQERLDEHYFESTFNIPEDCLTLLENCQGLEGDHLNQEFLSLIDYISAKDLSQKVHYDWVCQQIDIHNFIDYQLFQIFIANYDWPANNVKIWRNHCENSPWRWIFYDGDAAVGAPDFLGFAHATSEASVLWPTNASSTLFLRKFLSNDEFKQIFFHRLQALSSKYFSPRFTGELLNASVIEVKRSIPAQVERFNLFEDEGEWWNLLQNKQTFFCERLGFQSDEVKVLFNESMPALRCGETCELFRTANIYPNPLIADEFNLHLDLSHPINAEFTLGNLMGVCLMKGGIQGQKGEQDFQFLVSTSLPAGIYIFQLKAKDCSKSWRLVKY